MCAAVQRQRAAGLRAIWAMHSRCKQHGIADFSLRTRLFRTLAEPVLTYGAEAQRGPDAPLPLPPLALGGSPGPSSPAFGGRAAAPSPFAYYSLQPLPGLFAPEAAAAGRSQAAPYGGAGGSSGQHGSGGGGGGRAPIQQQQRLQQQPSPPRAQPAQLAAAPPRVRQWAPAGGVPPRERGQQQQREQQRQPERGAPAPPAPRGAPAAPAALAEAYRSEQYPTKAFLSLVGAGRARQGFFGACGEADLQSAGEVKVQAIGLSESEVKLLGLKSPAGRAAAAALLAAGPSRHAPHAGRYLTWEASVADLMDTRVPRGAPITARSHHRELAKELAAWSALRGSVGIDALHTSSVLDPTVCGGKLWRLLGLVTP
ncbi:MAG: hypothetical protein J3K34DRAFT_524897 [Monoraphidium minutum]|nr:MAG: hypothetical protein J3K34DRAFT_524897 [Monoraphidium minutum]